MANGITAVQIDAKPLKNPTTAASLPVYIGQAPIWQIDDANWKDLAGTTLVAKSLADVRENIGYCAPVGTKTGVAWDKSASLSMVAYYHMAIEQIAPIILIVNSANITTNSATQENITFVKGKASISNPYVVLSSVLLDGKVKGTDYTVAYDDDGQNVIITALTDMTTIEVSYETVKNEDITMSADTFKEVDFIPQNTKARPVTIAAPLWDDETDSAGKKVITRLIEIAEGVIDKHWYVEAFGQIDAADRAGAIAAKESITSPKIKVCWPYVQYGSYIYPVSLIFSARKQKVDHFNDDIPYESASNEEIVITRLCTVDGKKVSQLELEADELNAAGVATMAFTTSMGWRTWGVCMANYSEDNKQNISPNKLSDVNVQMMDYICNDFEERYGEQVHKPMSIRAVNNILVDYTRALRVLIANGMLIDGSISFEKSENSTADLADGQFTYTINQANTPAAKAIIAKVHYDSDALNQFFAEAGGAE